MIINLPNSASCTTTAQFITNNTNNIVSEDEVTIHQFISCFGFIIFTVTYGKHYARLLVRREKNQDITGHGDGTVKFWDVTCPLLIPLLSLTQQVNVFLNVL